MQAVISHWLGVTSFIEGVGGGFLEILLSENYIILLTLTTENNLPHSGAFSAFVFTLRSESILQPLLPEENYVFVKRLCKRYKVLSQFPLLSRWLILSSSIL